MKWKCASCGREHDGLPLTWVIPEPAPWTAIPQAERAKRGILGEENCEVDGKHFFVRGLIHLPIQGSNETFFWNVWVSLSEKNYRRALQMWNSPDRVDEPPSFGWLCVRLPLYPETQNLHTMVHWRPPGNRPHIEIEPTEHPLAVEQRNGITMERVKEIAEFFLHTT